MAEIEPPDGLDSLRILSARGYGFSTRHVGSRRSSAVVRLRFLRPGSTRLPENQGVTTNAGPSFRSITSGLALPIRWERFQRSGISRGRFDCICARRGAYL